MPRLMANAEARSSVVMPLPTAIANDVDVCCRRSGRNTPTCQPRIVAGGSVAGGPTESSTWDSGDCVDSGEPGRMDSESRVTCACAGVGASASAPMQHSSRASA